jgi:hypothetical protein
MPLPAKPTKVAKATPAAASAVTVDPPHQHQVPGVAPAPVAKPKPTIGGLKAGLLGLAKPATKKGAKKDHVIDLPDYAAQLQDLQQVNASIKAYEARKVELQGELYPAIEEQRRALCKGLMEYVGSIKLRAGPDSGVATYFIKNMWSGMDPSDAAAVQSAIEVVANALGMDADAATEWFNVNMKTKTEVTFNEEALDNPEVIALIQEQLGPYVTVKMTMVPSKHLAESASFNDESAAVLDGLEGARLVKRYGATLKPAGKTD